MAARNTRIFALVAAVALLGACPRPPAVSLSRVERRYRAEDYDAVLDRWTRSEVLIELQGLDDRLRVAGTYLSWDFRSAMIARYARVANLARSEVARLFEEARVAMEREHEFFIALATQRPRWGMLDRSSSQWHVALLDDRGREVAPTRIEPARRPSAFDQEFFPYVTPWRSVFRVYFPTRARVASGDEYEVLGPGTRYFVLRFSGPLGTLDLRWDVARDGR